ncbi:MAG: transcriptional regulator [Thermodesulfovibrionia bacterium]|nr:transcriptional regulator [Thermodesulfovibrionia bacterium]
MSYKFDSLMIILNKLDSKEKVTVQSLAEDLEVSDRTVHRYLNTLQIGGFPVHYDRTKESYVFVDGYSLRKPNLSVEETLSFALAKSMMKNFGAGMELGLNRIEKKLSSKASELPDHIILKSHGISHAVQGHLEKIHLAINNYQQIKIEYSKLSSGEITERKVDPYYLFFNDGFWYLRGHCHLSRALRTFALDRMNSLDVLNDHFVPKRLMPEDELSDTFGAWIDGEPTEVVLTFDKDFKHNIMRKKWFQHQRERVLDDGRLELSFDVKGLVGIKKWLYQWMPFVEVVAPKELRDAVRKELNQALHKHKK